MKINIKRIVWILILILVLILLLYPRFKAPNEQGPAKNMGGRKSAAIVRVDIVKPTTLREIIKSSGTLLPDEEVDLTFETSGKIETIYLKEGAQVKRGQLLAKLNDDDLLAQLNKFKIQLKLTKEKEARQKVLLEKEAISKEAYDQAFTDVQAIEADIKLVEARISDTEIHAPFDGTLGLRYVSEGAYVTPSTRVAKLVKMQPLKIDFAIPERYSSYIRKGLQLTFRTDGDTSMYKANVYAIEPKVDPNTRTIAVRALYENRNNILQPGKYVSVELIIREKKDAIQVPSESIVPELGKEKVFLVKNKKAVPAIVTTGLRTESTIEVISGVNPGDSLIVSGILQLRPDMPVVVENNRSSEVKLSKKQ